MVNLEELTTQQLDNLLIAIKNNFIVIEEFGAVIQDYRTDYFDMYQDLIKYCAENKEQLIKKYGNVTYGEFVWKLLQDELLIRIFGRS